MSAITGSGDPLTISFNASAASRSGTAGRTISQPESLSSWIWRSVALTSRVSVLVMVWTAIGAAPPMTTPPTLTGMDFLRPTARDPAGIAGRISLVNSWELPRRQPLDVEEADHGGQREQSRQAPPLEIQLAVAVERTAPQPLDDHDHNAAAVQRQERQEVRDAKRDREQSHQPDIGGQPLVDGVGRDLGDADRSCQTVRAEQAAFDLAGDQ